MLAEYGTITPAQKAPTAERTPMTSPLSVWKAVSPRTWEMESWDADKRIRLGISSAGSLKAG
jgi:hypothetical protein